MANIALVGQVDAQIDHVPVISITRVSIDESIPTVVKKGNYGVIGMAQGIADVTGSFTLAVPSTGTEVDLQALKSKAGGFTLTWSRGASRFSVVGCKISRIGDSDDPGAGNFDISVNFTATEILQVA